MPKLSDIMSEHLVTVTIDASIQDVARLMKQHDIGNVLVTHGDRLLGIVTDRDIVVRCLADGGDVTSTVERVMTANPRSLSPDTEVAEAARVMAEQQIRRLPVVQDGKPVGIVSLGDLAVRSESSADERALEGVSQPNQT